MVLDLGNVNTVKGLSRTVAVPVEQLVSGSYTLQMDLAGKRTAQRFMVVR